MNYMKRIRSEYFPDTSDRILFLCGAVMLSTEIWKQLVLTLSAGGHYNLWYLPFQLCSIPMYVLLAYPWLRREKIRLVILAFLMCYGLLGGIAAFADTSGMKYAYPALTVPSLACAPYPDRDLCRYPLLQKAGGRSGSFREAPLLPPADQCFPASPLPRGFRSVPDLLRHRRTA